MGDVGGVGIDRFGLFKRAGVVVKHLLKSDSLKRSMMIFRP